LPVAAINALANNANVKFASPDRKLKGHLEFAEPTTNANIALQYGYDGTGVGVAWSTAECSPPPGPAIAQHQDHPRGLPARASCQAIRPTSDGYGHGTHVAGIIASNGSSSSGSNAIYYLPRHRSNVNIINLRALDSTGQGTDSSVIDAINQAIALKSQYNIRVLNLSIDGQWWRAIL